MRKKFLILTVLMMASATIVHAGGLMTNTNYHIAFDRMMARGASTGRLATLTQLPETLAEP